MRRWSIVVALALASCGTTAAPEADSGAVDPSDPSDPIDPATAAHDALVDVRASGCGPRVGFGTATLIDDDLALTAAHVVAGADDVSVIDLDGADHRAVVVWFDPDLDVAALSVPTDIGRPVRLRPADTNDGDDTDDGDDRGEIDRGAIAVSRGAFAERTVTSTDVGIARHVDVRTTDIYREDEVVRPGFEIAGDIEPGDSGTMVVTADGAIGLVWSRSNATDGRAWAVDVPDEFRRAAFRSSLDTEVDRGPCLR